MKDMNKQVKRPKKGVNPMVVVLLIITIGVGMYFLGRYHNSDNKRTTNNDDIYNGISELAESEEFRESDKEIRGEAVEEYLLSAADEETTDGVGNTIIRESVERDDDSGACVYTDSSGAINVVQYERNMSYMDGEKNTMQSIDTPIAGETKGLMLYGLDNADSDLYKESSAIVERLQKKGSECAVDKDVTVEDYMTEIKGYDYVIINTHGNMLSYDYGFKNESADKVPVLCTMEDITASNIIEYEEDIREQRVVKTTIIENKETGETAQKYWVMPSFFKKYYSGSSLDGVYVHIGSCYSFGGNIDSSDSEDFEMADAFLQAGARAVTGYYNSVFTYYDYAMIENILNQLFEGNSLSVAVEESQKRYGRTDEEFAMKEGWMNSDSPNRESAQNKLEGSIAHMVVYGDKNMTFLKNEEKSEMSSQSIVGTWIDIEKRERLKDNLLWDDSVVFNADGSGSIAHDGGAITFNYEIQNDSTVLCTSFTGSQFVCTISGDTLITNGDDVINGQKFVYQGKKDDDGGAEGVIGNWRAEDGYGWSFELMSGGVGTAFFTDPAETSEENITWTYDNDLIEIHADSPRIDGTLFLYDSEKDVLWLDGLKDSTKYLRAN